MNRVCRLLTVALFCVVAAGAAAQTALSPAIATNDWSCVTPAELRAAAVRGEAGAQFALGRALFRGDGVAQVCRRAWSGSSVRSSREL